MFNKTLNETSGDHEAWSQHSSASKLPSSESDMSAARKALIRKSLDFEIIDIRSYVGYKGDPLVVITTMDTEVVDSMKTIAESLALEVIVQQDIIKMYKIFCVSPATHAYDLL